MRKFLLPLNLQVFAEEVAGADPQGSDLENGTQQTTNKGGEKTFTQAELEVIIAERLAREKRKAEQKAEEARKEAERKALEEQGKYKEMYEELLQEIEAQKAQALEIRKETLLLGAGYTQEQAERYKKYLTGSTDEELAEALETLKADIPPAPKYVDPVSLGNGRKTEPQQVDPAEYGKSLFAKLKQKGRIR